jgi:hypothetical protein
MGVLLLINAKASDFLKFVSFTCWYSLKTSSSTTQDPNMLKPLPRWGMHIPCQRAKDDDNSNSISSDLAVKVSTKGYVPKNDLVQLRGGTVRLGGICLNWVGWPAGRISREGIRLNVGGKKPQVNKIDTLGIEVCAASAQREHSSKRESSTYNASSANGAGRLCHENYTQRTVASSTH